MIINQVLTEAEIKELLENPLVIDAQQQLTNLSDVKFSMELSNSIKDSLKTKLGIDLSDVYHVPLRWSCRDVPNHVDIGETDFHRQKFRTLDLSNLPKPTEPESKREKWLKAQKILAKEYVDSCLKYLIDNGKMIVEPNWFCKRTVGEIIAIIMGFLTILLAIVLPFTCSQGKIQGAADAKEKIHYLETERDSLKVILLDCLSNLPKPVNNPKEKEGNSTIPNN